MTFLTRAIRVSTNSGMDTVNSRYSRHILLNVIGQEGQTKIEAARVLVTGQGALGSLISVLLARAGVGFLRIVDKDLPEIHNLHRQILYDDDDCCGDITKVQAARRHLVKSAPSLEIDAVHAEITAENVDSIVNSVDVVVDAVDNSETRYLVNDAALRNGIPYVFGGAVETAGNVMTIVPGVTPCLRCLWPVPEDVRAHQRASTVGVLSSLATLVASVQVTEVMKLLVGDLDKLIPGLLTIDVWRNHYMVVSLERSPGCLCSQYLRKVQNP